MFPLTLKSKFLVKQGGNLLYFTTWQVANKSELNTSTSVGYNFYLIDGVVFNPDLFSHHFNEEKQLKKGLVIIVLLILCVKFIQTLIHFSKFAK